MDGYKLFYDDHLDALKQAVDNNIESLTFKQVAAKMWPHLKPDSAYARLKACLRADKDEKLDLAEVRHLCTITGRSEPLYWLCDETCHARPAARSKEDKQAELMREFNVSVSRVMTLAKQLEAAGVPILKVA